MAPWWLEWYFGLWFDAPRWVQRLPLLWEPMWRKMARDYARDDAAINERFGLPPLPTDLTPDMLVDWQR